MKKIVHLTVLFITYSLFAHTQKTQFQWAKHAGSYSSDSGHSIAVDTSGNVYTVGSFVHTADFKSGTGPLTSMGSSDIFVSKHDSSGNIVWAKQLGGDYAEIAYSLTLDSKENILITGYFTGIADFDPSTTVYNLTSYGSTDIFICKLDTDGNFLWTKQIRGNDFDLGYSIASDKNNIYVTGFFTDTIDVDPGTGTQNFISKGYFDTFLVKLDENGEYIWAKQFGGDTLERGTAINVDDHGYIYLSGAFSSKVDFQLGAGTFNLTSKGMTDAFHIKMDSNGNVLWVNQLGGPLTEIGKPVAVDSSGNMYVTSTFHDSIDVDPSSNSLVFNSNGSSDICIRKLDAQGNLIWAKQIGGKQYDNIRNIVLDDHNNLYMIGSFEDTVDFDPGTGISYLYTDSWPNIYILKLDSDGNFIWVKHFGNHGYADRGYYLVVDKLSNIYTTGTFHGTVDFDLEIGVFELTAEGNNDIFILKIKQCYSKAPPLEVDTCNSYQWHENVYTTSGTYFDTIQNVAGCDSLVTLKLKINSSSTTLNATACDSFLWNQKIYTSSGFYSDTVSNSVGCDSIITLNLIIHNATSSIENVKTCNLYYWRGKDYSSTGTYYDTLPNSLGCDSILTLQLIINNTSSSSTNVAACDSYTWLDNTYSSSGTYRDTIPNVSNCDSVMTLKLTIDSSSSSTKNVTACDHYTWRGDIYTASGIYFDTIPNSVGCDSIMTLNLTITNVEASLSVNPPVLSANYSNGNYQWIDCNKYNQPIINETFQNLVVTSLGAYAVIVSKGECIDTSSCYNVQNIDFLEDFENLRPTIIPNPTKGVTIIKFERELQNATLTIMNTIGELIFIKEKFNGKSLKVELNSFANGLYIVDIKEGDGFFRAKIVKQ